MAIIFALKQCTNCGVEKESTDFYKDKRRKDGLCSECKKCKIKLTIKYKNTSRGKIVFKKASRKYEKTLNGIESRRKKYLRNPEPYFRRAAERKRFLGWIPLNEPTEGYEAHHIGKNYIIFIPHDVHRSIRHNLKTGEGMKEINQIAFSYLLPGVNWEGDVYVP